MAGVRKRWGSLLGPKGIKGDKGDTGAAGAAWVRPALIAGQDFNTVTLEGTYPVPFTNLPNQPFAAKGNLRVEVVDGGIVHTFKTWETPPRESSRRYTGSIWGAWEQTVTKTIMDASVASARTDLTASVNVAKSEAASGDTAVRSELTTAVASARADATAATALARTDLTAAIDASAWPKGSLAATDWNALYTPGIHRISSTGHTNMPPLTGAGSVNGFLTITNIAGGVWAMQEFVRQGTAYERWWRMSTTTGGAWSPWILNNGSRFIALVSGSDVNALPVSGTYEVTSTSIAPNVANLPVAQPGVLEHFRTTNGIIIQRYTTYGATQTVYLRTSLSVTQGTLGAWAQISGGSSTPTPATPSSEAGLTNELLMQDFTRRRGGRKRVTTGVVSLRFDHGLANFNTKIRPLLEARNLPYSLALCSGQWDRAENVGVTAAMVNAWVVGGLAEIWNHTKDHGSGDNSDAQWKAAILDGLTELRAQIPAAQIDGFAPPGTSGVDFGGFVAGTSVQQFYATEGGRFILANHAVSAGYITGVQRVLDGQPRQGLTHSTIDSATLASVQTLVQAAEAQKRGLQLMLHPSLLDTASYMTTATLTTVLDYIVAERDADRIEVMGPYDSLLADVV